MFFISLSIGYEKADAGFVSRLSRLVSELRCENYWKKSNIHKKFIDHGTRGRREFDWCLLFIKRTENIDGKY
jgi:hypothetical protein